MLGRRLARPRPREANPDSPDHRDPWFAGRVSEDTSGTEEGPQSAADAAAELADRVKEAAYAAVGLGVLGLQSLQVRRREVAKQVEPQVREAALRLQRAAAVADEAVNPVLERLEGQLPDATRDLVRTARTAATEARDTLLDKAKRPR